MAAVPIESQVKEVERELALRRGVYPHQVARGRLDERTAAAQIAAMEAALKTLRFVEKHAATIKALVEEDMRDRTEATE